MDLFAAIRWNVSPEIFSIGPIHIRWYGLLFALGFVVGYQIMTWIFAREGKQQRDLEALSIYMIIGTVVGARLGHCLLYAPGYYLSNPIEILKIWEGGLASHGAAIVIIIAISIYSYRRRKKFTMFWVLDRIVIVGALAGFLIRMGNLFNSEIVGLPSDLPWAIIFARRQENFARHPAQLYESLCYLIIFLILFFRYKKYKALLPDGQLFGIFLILVFGCRFFIEFLKEYQSAFERALPLDMGQLLSLPFIAVGIAFLIWSRRKK